MNEPFDPNVALRAMVSIRGLQDSGNRTPVEQFQGDLVAVVPRQGAYQGQNRTFIDLKFANCVIMRVTPGETYNFETVDISIRLSNQKNSGWGKFADSLATKIPADKEIWDCIGTRMELEQKSFSYGSRTENQQDPNDPTKVIAVTIPIIANSWIVTSLVGNVTTPQSSNGGVAQERALSVLDGRTLAQFNEEVWKEPAVKADPNLSSMLLNNQWVPTMVAAKVVVEDGAGVYHRQVAGTGAT
jgi:hypothetical protein